ncbi:conserved exported hypothetical protein [Burkholderiales bacterium]|nr:conserved exported hypothetical protein [Burkholderiales bacterium]
MNRSNRSLPAVRAPGLTAVLGQGAHRAILSFWVLAALCLVLLAAGRARAAEPWPEIPMPPKAKVQWVADSMRVNGVPMRVMQFQSPASRAEIVEYYRAYWSGGYPTKPSVSALGEATVVGQAHGPYFMTVKVQDAAHASSQGLIAVSRVLGSKIERNAGDLALMPGARVVSVVESNDPGKRSREVLVFNTQPPPSVVRFYEASLQSAGWRQVQHNDAPRTANGPGGSFLVYARDRSELQLSVAARPNGQGSQLLANLVTKDTGPQPF